VEEFWDGQRVVDEGMIRINPETPDALGDREFLFINALEGFSFDEGQPRFATVRVLDIGGTVPDEQQVLIQLGGALDNNSRNWTIYP
jgi:hypothetical protein